MNTITTSAFLLFTTMYAHNTACMLSKPIRPLEETKQTPQYKNKPTKNNSKAIIQPLPSQDNEELFNQQLLLNVRRQIIEDAEKELNTTTTTGYCPIAFVRTGRSAVRMRPLSNFDNK